MPNRNDDWIEVPPGPRPRVPNNAELAAKLIELAHALHAMGCHQHVATCKDAARRLRGGK